MSEEKASTTEEQGEAPDEWTVLANSYTASLVPAFAPIYETVGDIIVKDLKVHNNILDFGCGPGEPSLTLANTISPVTIVGVDSTQVMLDIAKKRSDEANLNDRVSLHHVRRDITMEDLEKSVGRGFDAVVSTFVLHYVDFARRVELTSTFLKLAPEVIYATWGPQSQVGFLRALKTFGTWKGSKGEQDICTVKVDDADDGTVQSPRGSFSMARKETFQGIVDEIDGAIISSFETRTILIKFPNVSALLSFLPFPTIDDNDCQVMLKLLSQWSKQEGQVSFSGEKDKPMHDQGLFFPTSVVFCRLSRDEISGPTAKKQKSS